MDRLKTWSARFLLAFVLVTIGFAAGRRTAPTPIEADTITVTNTKNHVILYAAHMTFRCAECNQIEWLARELVEAEFAEELASKRLEFRSVDYMQNVSFAQRYNISASTIVVARIEDGEEKGFIRLDEVWVKLRDRDEFFKYVRQAIQDSLGRESGV